MKNKAVEFLEEYQISKEQLNKLTSDQQAAVAVLCYAVSEVNALSKLYLSCSEPEEVDEAINYAALIQKFVVLRTWSAKLFETEEFLKFGGKKKQTSDEVLLELAASALEGFDGIRESKGYEFARNLRHEATNHYSFSAAKKNLGHVSKNANFNMYIHQMSGNSFYPMGEEVMFMGRMNRTATGADNMEEKMTLLRTWMDWNLEGSKWLNEAHRLFVQKLIIDLDPNKRARKRSYYLPLDCVGKAGESVVPLFLRKRVV